MKRKGDHVILNTKTGALECRHCGDSYLPRVPCPLYLFADMLKSYAKHHEECEEPDAATVAEK